MNHLNGKTSESEDEIQSLPVDRPQEVYLISNTTRFLSIH